MRPREDAPLSERLQDMETVLRRCLAAGKAPNLDTVAGLHVMARDFRLAAEALEIKAGLEAARAAALMEHARLGEIGPKSGPAISEKRGELVELRFGIARQQEELQAALDAGDEDAAAALIANHALGELADMVLAGPVLEPKPEGQPCEVIPFLGVRYQRNGAASAGGHDHDGGDAA